MLTTTNSRKAVRWGRSIALLAAITLFLTACMSPDQQRAFDLVNASRSGSGVRTLQSHPQLEAKAQAWAERMAREGRIFHSNLSDGISANWRALGENVGYGSSIDQVHNAYLNSQGHRRNIMDTRFTHLGTGVAWANGKVYTVQVFMQL